MTSREDAFLQIEGITKLFGDFPALRGVSLSVGKGEFVCFLGPSGCGKTTLLRAIAGLETQTSGRILQDGREISWLPPNRRDFGIVFQSYALFPNLNVAKNIGYGLRSLGMAKQEIDRRVQELMDLVGIGDQGSKFPSQLSGGQQQRVALARALALSPGLLLLDEPLSALDARVRVKLRFEIKALQRRLGVTTIMVTHDQEEALVLADRIIVMSNGAIEQIGTPIEIYRQPASPFVADFVGHMNFLPGVAEGADRVRIGNAVFEHTNLSQAPASGPVMACIRPEDISVRGIETGASNTLKVNVRSMTFLGSVFQAELVSDELGDISLQSEMSVNAVSDFGVRPGVLLTIRIPVERLRVFAQASGQIS